MAARLDQSRVSVWSKGFRTDEQLPRFHDESAALGVSGNQSGRSSQTAQERRRPRRLGHNRRRGRAICMERKLGKLQQCRGARSRFRQHVQDGRLGFVLVHYALFVMVVCGTFQMHLGMRHLKTALVVKRDHLPARCKGLADKGEQQNDCEQSAHGGCGQGVKV